MSSTPMPGAHAPAAAPSTSFTRLHQTIGPWVQSHPERVALMDAERSLRYGELDSAIAETARALAAQGVRGGDRVVLVTENSVGCAVLILALSALDAWAVPVNARLSAREIDNIVEHCGARIALYLDSAHPEAREHGLARGAQPAEWPHVGRLLLGATDQAAVAEPVEAAARGPGAAP
ncbi:AMP-binding protein, partial [Cupriavidus sp. SK-3]|uniref:AMP-binding protein n=1 Tax=Cupriavidus sp. SK-3 TaxID=1470558 RepID=UPI001F2FB6CD